MQKNGWIKLHRRIQANWIWQSSNPFDKRSAWIDLLLLANHEDKKTLLGNELISIKRGEHITSERKLAKRWGWSRNKVRNFLEVLEKDSMILLDKKDQKRTGIKVLNYSDYQGNEDRQKTSQGPLKDQPGTTKGPAEGQKKDQKRTGIKALNYSDYQGNEDRQKTDKRPARDQPGTTKGPKKDTNKNNKNKKNYKEKRKRYIPFPEIIDHLNLRIGTSYKATSKKTQSLISARWKEGFKIDDFKAVVDKKCVEWAGTDMEKYLRPETLFGTKFEGYLNQPTAKKRNKQQEQDELLREIYEEAEG
jgi:uncharacterized phage protein (TIGR02220 family)